MIHLFSYVKSSLSASKLSVAFARASDAMAAELVEWCALDISSFVRESGELRRLGLTKYFPQFAWSETSIVLLMKSESNGTLTPVSELSHSAKRTPNATTISDWVLESSI